MNAAERSALLLGAGQASYAVDTEKATSNSVLNTCLVGTWDQYAGTYSDIWADGNYAYMGNYGLSDGFPARVMVFDITDPTAPALDEELFIPAPNNNASPQDVKVGDGLLFVALEGDFDDGVVIYDVRNAAARSLIATVRVPGYEIIHNVFYEGGYLYMVTSGWGPPSVAIVDLTTFDPDNPPPSPITTAKWIVSPIGTSMVHDITVKGNRLYAAAWDSGMWVYDITNIATSPPSFLGSTPGNNLHSMWPTDDGQFVVTGEERGGGGIAVYEITDNGGSLSFTFTDAFQSPNPSTFSVHNQLIVGNRLYNSWYGDGLQVFDIDVNGLLQFVAGYDTSDSGLGNWGVYPFLGDNKILLSDAVEGLIIVELTPDPCVCFPSSPAVAETQGLQVSVKNRTLSVQAGDAGRNQAIRVTANSLPAPYDIWNGAYAFAGAPIQVCENGGQGASVAPPNCASAPGLSQRWSWFAPLVCGESSAHFTDWTALANRCVGGSNDGGLCTDNADCPGASCGADPTVHLFHPGIVPSRLAVGGGSISVPAQYTVQVVDSTCLLNFESSYSSPLQVTTAAYGDVVDNLMACPNGVSNLNVDIVGDVLAVITKFSNGACAVSKARAKMLPRTLTFTVDIADALGALEGFSGGSYSITPGDPCGM